MKLIIQLLIVVLLSWGRLAASEDVYLISRAVDGLPFRLSTVGIISQELAPGAKTIDLGEFCKQSGIRVPENGYVLYESGRGMLLSRLDHQNQDKLDDLITYLYRGEELPAVCRAYHDMFAPLTNEKRLERVLQIGYVPDPLIAALANRLSAFKKPISIPQKDPFAPDVEVPRKFTEKDIQQIKILENQITALLEISLQRLKQQLEVLDEAAPQPSSKQP